VVQRTGEDWSAARISLSTAQPAVAGDPPDLRAPVLSFPDAPHSMHARARAVGAESPFRGTGVAHHPHHMMAGE